MDYDQEFEQAMKLKLQMNRQAKASSQGSEASATPSAPYDRSAEVQALVAKHPGLTPEKAEQGLRELGF